MVFPDLILELFNLNVYCFQKCFFIFWTHLDIRLINLIAFYSILILIVLILKLLLVLIFLLGIDLIIIQFSLIKSLLLDNKLLIWDFLNLLRKQLISLNQHIDFLLFVWLIFYFNAKIQIFHSEILHDLHLIFSNSIALKLFSN